MTNLPPALLTTAAALYLAAFFFYFAVFLGAGAKLNQTAQVLVRIGFLIHTFFFFTDFLEVGGRPALPLQEGLRFGQVMAFFSWALAFVYLVLLAKVQSESFGLILAPLLAFLTGTGLARFSAAPLPLPSPTHPYFLLHLGTAFFAYASFTLSFVAALLYLIQHRELKRRKGGTFYHRLPSLEALEGLIYQPMAWGVFLLGLAIVIGFLWSKSAFGSYWLGEPKTITTIGITLFYATLVFLHYGAASRGKRGVVLSLIAFVFLFFNFFGMPLLASGLHPLMK